MTNPAIGRQDVAKIDNAQRLDAPEKTVAALNTKLDQVIDGLNALIASIAVATDGPSLYTALAAATPLATALNKLKFTL